MNLSSMLKTSNTAKLPKALFTSETLNKLTIQICALIVKVKVHTINLLKIFERYAAYFCRPSVRIISN